MIKLKSDIHDRRKNITKFEKLLSSGRIGSMELKNRFVVPPMGTNFGTYEGFVTDQMIEYYRARALGDSV